MGRQAVANCPAYARLLCLELVSSDKPVVRPASIGHIGRIDRNRTGGAAAPAATAQAVQPQPQQPRISGSGTASDAGDRGVHVAAGAVAPEILFVSRFGLIRGWLLLLA